MPEPSPEHAPIMLKLSKEILKAFPTASVFHWHVLIEEKTGKPGPYITMLLDKKGGRLEDGSENSKENKIVRKYGEQLGWDSDERDASYVFSVKDAREITDVEGHGVLDPKYKKHPGLEMFA